MMTELFFFLFGYLLVLKHVSTCRRILLQKDSAFEMRSAKEQDIISNSKHCINAMTSYQFRVIVGLSILRHSIHFEILYSYRDIHPRHHIHFKKAHISLFSLAIEKKQKKKILSICILDLKNGL